jgi:LCP family protein required for cell wall assembly
MSASDGRQGSASPAPRARRLGHVGPRRWLLAASVVASLGVVGALVWLALGYLAVSAGVAAANKRLPAIARAALVDPNGSLLAAPANVLLLGIDHSAAADRSGDHHSDSIMVLRTDPAHHQLAYLSIPRDLLASIPGVGEQKINAAMQVGGPALAVRTIGAFTGLPINHVVVVDFASFAQLINAVGGITIDVPEAIVSDQFDCPYPAALCATWRGWHFARGIQHMDARQALIYSRIRVNRLNPADSDATRALHQQQVMQAVLSKLASLDTLVGLPLDGGSLLRPLATDLSAWDFVELGWIKLRTSTVLHCRLGGVPDGQGDLLPSSQANAQVIREVVGEARPQAPLPSAGIYAPGCVSGSQAFS